MVAVVGEQRPVVALDAVRLAREQFVAPPRDLADGLVIGTANNEPFAATGFHVRLALGALSVDVEARKAYERDRGAIVASAITRMVARIVAGQAAKAATQDDLAGTLISLGLQAGLTAADTPDTRSWSTVPGRVALTRIAVEPGPQKIELQAQGVKKTLQIDLKAGDWEAVALTVLK